MEFKEQMHEYSVWRAKLVQAVEMYHQWRSRYGMNDPHSADTILNILDGLQSDKITLAFVAEFSRGKTELINALFFCRNRCQIAPVFTGAHHYVAYRTFSR